MQGCLSARTVVLLRCILSLYTSYQLDASTLGGARRGPATPLTAAFETERDYMKRQKRDMNTRAFDRGYMAGVSGRSSDICPHEDDEHRQNWLSGWREGRSDQWDGLTGVSGVHKMRAV